MANRVFDQRLEQERRYRRIHGIWLHLTADNQSVAKTDLLYFQVSFHKFKFLAERDFVPRRYLQRCPQKLTERTDHVVGQGGTLMNQGRDRIESIKKEVWLKLHFQGLKIGLGKTRFQFQCAALAFISFLIMVEKPAHTHDAEVNGDGQPRPAEHKVQ